MDVVAHFSHTIQKILDIAQFSPEEKKSLTADLVLSLLTKTFYIESNSLSKEKDHVLAEMIRQTKDPSKIMKIFAEALDPVSYQATLKLKAQEMLEKFVETVSAVAPEEKKNEFQAVLEDFLQHIPQDIN